MSNAHNRLTVTAPARCPLELREQARARARSGAVAVKALSKPERFAGSKSRIEHKEGSNNMEQFVGIDVSKAWLDGEAVPQPRPMRHGNDSAGIATLVSALVADPPALVVLEATGGFETEVASALAAGVPTVVVNPKPVRDF